MTYPIRGTDSQDRLYWTQIPLAINCIFLLCTVSLLIAAWISKGLNGRCQSQAFYFLLTSMLLTAVTTVLSITVESLFLANAYVGPSYQMFRGFYAFCYYPTETVLVAAIFAILHNRLRSLSLGIISSGMQLVMYLNYFIVITMFIFSGAFIGFNFRYGIDLIYIINGKFEDSKITRYIVQWDRVIMAYYCLVVAIGLYLLCFLVYLLGRAWKQRATKADIKIILFMVSPALVIHGLYYVALKGVFFSGLVSPSQTWLWVELVSTFVDAVTFTCMFSGMVWVLLKRGHMTTSVSSWQNTRNPGGEVPGLYQPARP